MKHLVIKDFRVLKLMNLAVIAICLAGGYMGISYENTLKTKFVYAFAILITTYLASILLSQQEVKNNSDIIINSLPIDRSLIVKSKYLFILIYMCLSSLIVFLSSHVSGVIFPNNTPGVGADVFDILFIIGLALIFYSVYLLIYYFNIGKAQIFGQVFYLILVLAPAFLGRFGERIVSSSSFKYLMSLNFNFIISLLIAVGLIFYVISLNSSIKIYESKEF